jgi:hypothetical protein
MSLIEIFLLLYFTVIVFILPLSLFLIDLHIRVCYYFIFNCTHFLKLLHRKDISSHNRSHFDISLIHDLRHGISMINLLLASGMGTTRITIIVDLLDPVPTINTHTLVVYTDEHWCWLLEAQLAISINEALWFQGLLITVHG